MISQGVLQLASAVTDDLGDAFLESPKGSFEAS